ncbi:MAG: hypothetical protein GKS05_11590 [Nitrospirales bacterium]|nr:hypothetical protein [Nitrospirales bacterium]
MIGKKLYKHIYEQFLEKHTHAKGYDFQESDVGSTRPQSVSFMEKLKWWTLNRPTRLRAITKERDRLQQDILAIKQPIDSPTSSSSE